MSQNPGVGTSNGTVQPVSTKTPLTALTPTFATVGTSSAQAVASNTNRKGLILVNTSSNIISLGIGSNAAVLNSGITLVPYGVYSADEYEYFTSAVNAIASAGSSNLAIQEFM